MGTATLVVDTLTNNQSHTWSGAWVLTGTTPYLEAQDQPTNMIANKSGGAGACCKATFEDFALTNVTLSSVTLKVYNKVLDGFAYRIYINDGSDDTLIISERGVTTSEDWELDSYDVTSTLDTIDKINSAYVWLEHATTSGTGVWIDYVYLEVNYVASVVIPVGDTTLSIGGNTILDQTILALNLHLGATKEISSFEAIIDRGNLGYDNQIDPGEANVLTNGAIVTVSLGKSALPLLFTGNLEEIEYEDEAEEYEFRNIVRCRGRCNGHQLFDRKFDGDLIALVGSGALTYRRTEGEAEGAIAYLIDNYTSLSHTRVNDTMVANANSGQKDVTVTDGTKFTVGDLVKIADDSNWEYNKIASIASNVLTMDNNLINNYTTAANGIVYLDLIRYTSTAYTELKYIQTNIFEIISFIAETADLSGTIGYDFRIEYDGKFAFFSIGSINASYTLQDDIQINLYIKDATRIKNKITVFGKQDMPYPTDVDGQIYSDSITDLATPSNQAELAANANSGQPDITVDTDQGAQFSATDVIWIADTGAIGKGEQLTISSIAGDVITCTTNLVKNYTTANQAIIYELFTNGGWGFYPWDADGANIVSENTIIHTGTYSVEFQILVGITSALPLFVFRSGTTVDIDQYSHIKAMMYFATTQPDYVSVRLYSDETGNGYAFSNPIRINEVDEWVEIDVEGGSKSADNWNVGSSFNWNAVKRVGIYVHRSVSATFTFYIDRLHFFGKRWGGGTNHAATDGFREDVTSQGTYGIKELVMISDLLLSNSECEAKAKSLLNFYKDERVTIEAQTRTLDWENYHLMAADKVAADFDLMGVTGSSYRIDSIDVTFNSRTNEITLLFSLDKPLRRFADYLFSISQAIRNLNRRYGEIR